MSDPTPIGAGLVHGPNRAADRHRGVYRAAGLIIDEWDRAWLRMILHLELDHGELPPLQPSALQARHNHLHDQGRPWGPMGPHDLENVPEMRNDAPGHDRTPTLRS